MFVSVTEIYHVIHESRSFDFLEASDHGGFYLQLHYSIFVYKINLKEGACSLFFRPRTRPKTFLQCFALEQRKHKTKHCRNVEKIRYKFGALVTFKLHQSYQNFLYEF